MALPIVGSVDWKWFLIGALFVWFVLPMISGLLHRGKEKAAA